MYEILTQYLTEFTKEEFGKRIIDKENDGTLEHPKEMPFVNYAGAADSFIHDLYSFVDTHQKMDLYNYSSILNENGIEWSKDSMEAAMLDNLDARCILALILGAVRAERFCDGAFLGFLESGSILRWLKKLKELDT